MFRVAMRCSVQAVGLVFDAEKGIVVWECATEDDATFDSAQRCRAELRFGSAEGMSIAYPSVSLISWLPHALLCWLRLPSSGYVCCAQVPLSR